MNPRTDILILGLGNDLLGDDGVGILAARALKEQVGAGIDVVESSQSGLALLDLLVGYLWVVIIDARMSGKHPPGTILAQDSTELEPVQTPSPHYAGLPEMLALAGKYELPFPQEIRIFSVEATDLYTIGGGLSPAVRGALPELVARVAKQAESWRGAGYRNFHPVAGAVSG